MPVTPDSYAVASGSISAGIPSWVPPINTLVDISTNTLYSTKGTDAANPTRAIFDAWCGVAYAPDYGVFGSIIATGGGHADGSLNAVYCYDIASRTWSKIKDSAPVFINPTNSLVADTVTGWMWADTTGTIVQDGEPFASHTYAGLVGLPASAIAGSTNGWIITAGRGTMPITAAGATKRGQKLNLGTDVKFTHHGASDFGNGGTGYGGACYDSTRNRLVSFAGSNLPSFSWLDLTTQAMGNINYTNAVGAGVYFDAYYSSAHYDSQSDLYYIAKASSAFTLTMISPTGQVKTATVSGTLPTTPGGWEWAQELGCMVFFSGVDNDVYIAKKPSNPLTGTWYITKRTLAGTVQQRSASAPHYTRMRWINKIKSFLWVSKTEQAVQIFRLGVI